MIDRTAPIPFALTRCAVDGAALRAQVDAAGLTRFDLGDRGRFMYNDTLAVPEIFERLRAAGEALAARPLAVSAWRWLMLRRGDYSLTRGDALTRPAGPHVELTLDLSAASSPEAQIVYTDGSNTVFVPQVAGQVSVVERDDGIYRWERYLGVRMGDIAVYRLRLVLT